MLNDSGQEAGDFKSSGTKSKAKDKEELSEKACKVAGVELDPVYKKLSAINGEINKMSREELQLKLAELKLNTRGVNDVLKKRLKSHFRQKKLIKAKIKPPEGTPYDYLMVIDFEATCKENTQGFPHEIIEFPVILIDVLEMKTVDEFHAFCRPTLNPKLSEFCTRLTGISQEKVDESEVFPTVLQRMESWMQSHHLGSGHTFAVVTDGPWDMSRFLSLQCDISDIPFPRWGKKWINIRKAYSNYYQCKRCKLEEMLVNLGMHFEGTLHCGLHDSRNIAHIAVKLMEDGCALKVNEYIHFVRKRYGKTEVEVKGEEQVYEEGSRRKQNINTSCDDIGKSLTALSVTEQIVEEEGTEDLLEYYRLQRN